MKETNSPSFVCWISVTLTNADWRGLQVNSQICLIRLLRQLGHLCKKLEGSAILASSACSWDVSQQVFVSLTLAASMCGQYFARRPRPGSSKRCAFPLYGQFFLMIPSTAQCPYQMQWSGSRSATTCGPQKLLRCQILIFILVESFVIFLRLPHYLIYIVHSILCRHFLIDYNVTFKLRFKNV